MYYIRKKVQNKKMAKKWSKWPQIKKNKLTLSYETLKVEEIKVVLFFQFEVILTPFWSFFEK